MEDVPVNGSDIFRDAVQQYLSPYAANFNYANMLNGHLDISRFYGWVEDVARYREIVGSDVLCSGCGSAGDLMAFLQAGASRACGIEVDDGLADLARKRFVGTRFESVVAVQVYDGSTLPYESDAFDIVFSMHVIEHTKDPAAYLAELFRVLRFGGIIFLDVPNRYYRIEQHILIPYIHYLPTKQRDGLIRILLSPFFSRWLSADAKYKFENYSGVYFPSADQLVAVYHLHRTTYSLDLRDAFYHSCSARRVPYAVQPGKYLFGPARKMTTFRLVIGKTSIAERVG
jgi:SAM-dependent methyltransferase